MYKRSPSRNQRSKGVQIKHILQVFLLVAVCFWLIYQVKHSHDKKREFDDSAKSSLAIEQKDGVVKLGRKDLNPRMEDKVVKIGKQDEEEDDETPVEEEDNKHEETEDRGDGKTEEKEEEEEDEDVDEESNGGEEIDDQNQENSDTDNDPEVDFEDEEKERDNVDEQTLRDKVVEDNNGQTENDSVSRKHYKGDITNTHDAREENYKADDASSAVIHDTQIKIPDNQTRIVGKSNQQAEVNELEHQNQSITPDEVGTGQNPPVKDEGGKTANDGSYLASKTVGQSETATATLNMIEESKVHKNNNNSTAVRIEPQELPLAGWNRTFSEHNQDENVVEGHKNTGNISKFQITDNKLEDSSTLPAKNDPDDFRSTINIYTKDIDPKLKESKKSDGSKPSISKLQANISAKTEESFHDAKDNGAAEMNVKLDESYSETSDELQIDPIDSSDTTNSLEEKYTQ